MEKRLDQSFPGETLHARISLLLGWEKRKRREATLTVALFYAFLAALAAPLFVYLSPGWAWAAPVAIFAALTPCLFFARRWRDQDTARALAALDKTLRLDERATTAWELLQRNETKAVALLVLREAADMLKSFDARALFPRSWGWHAWLLAPLIALWLAMLLFDIRFQPQSVAPGPGASLAQKLREFRGELQEKAQSERLPQTLRAARELEKSAQRGIDARTADEQFKSELAGMGKRWKRKGALPGRPRSAWLKAGASSTISEQSWKPRANCSTRLPVKPSRGKNASPA